MNKIICRLFLLSFGICLPLQSNAALESTVSADFAIDVPVVQVGSDYYSLKLNYVDSLWRVATAEPIQTEAGKIAATYADRVLSVACLVYLGTNYAISLNLIDDGSDEVAFELGTTEAISSCSTSDSLLVNVADYELQDTAEVLSAVSVRLQGLPIEEFYEQSFLSLRERDVESLISNGEFEGIEKESVNLNDISDAYDTQTTRVKALILETLQQYQRESLSEELQLSYDVYSAYLQYELEWGEFRNFEFPATYGFFGLPGNTESFFTEFFTISDRDQAEIYLVLLNQIGRRFAQISERLETRKSAGIIEPKGTLGYSQSVVAAMANTAATSSSYYQAFDSQLSALSDISAEDKQSLRAESQSIIEQKVRPAYQALSEHMLALLEEAPEAIGFGQYEGGKEFYDFTLRYYTSGNLSADEIYNLGIEELARIHLEMRKLLDELGYPSSQSIERLMPIVELDSGTVAAADTQSFYENIVDQTYPKLADYFLLLPQQEVAVVDGPCGGCYITGSDDGSRPGVFSTSTSRDMAYLTMPTLAYHEAVPGHHLQIALANELDLPLFRRKVKFTSFTEGWGLYAERLAKDAGWYDGDPYGDIGRLQFEAMRAARLVVDTGIHSKGWDYGRADQFHSYYVGIPGSIARYSVWPGQATAYMSGMLKILELREFAEFQLGDLYDIKDFHSEVVGHGSMPLDILEQVIGNYVEESIASQQ